jgi:hypothetical protein
VTVATWDRTVGQGRSAANRAKPLLERFWEKVEPSVDCCWEWLGARNPSGHGRFWVNGKNTPAHRFAYELAYGLIPDGAHLDHLCRNPSCVRPDHLEPVSLWENLRRSSGQVAVLNAAKTHCKRGHEFTPENTYIAPSGSRSCRTCMRAHYEQRKAAQA